MDISKQEPASNEVDGRPTQHAMLVAWGLFAQEIGLVEGISQVKLHQKTKTHRPQKKVLEFLVAMLAGLPHLQDISRSAHPLDQDQVVAEAWGQTDWADYSGVSRTLQQLSADEVAQISAELNRISQPFIDREIEQALHKNGRIVYDGDLTGRPVSSTSQSYPDAAFGYMGDEIRLGYQAAVVSLESPTYHRLWLANQLHAGDTVSVTQAQSLVYAAELRTGLRPRRRTELVSQRLADAQKATACADERYRESEEQLHLAKQRVKETTYDLRHWQQEVYGLEAAYAVTGQQPTNFCKLTLARRKVTTYEQRLPRAEQALARAEQRLQRHLRDLEQGQGEGVRLQAHLAQLTQDNMTNPQPIQALFRLDSGFASRENIAWLIEMGYDIYTKARTSKVQDSLSALLTPETTWYKVGANASLTAWSNTTVNDAFIYPLNVALARYRTGDSHKHAVLLHYGTEDVLLDLDAWFHRYNARQTIEAGIKEGKNVFQMHHLKVRSPHALVLQEQFACFAANFIRFATHALAHRQPSASPILTASVKHLVQVCAHASAWVLRQGDVWLITFAAQTLYAGLSLRFGSGPLQLPLPLFHDIHFSHF